MKKIDSMITDAVSIGDLYPSLDETERREAEENLDRYLALAVRIYERSKAKPSCPEDAGALTVFRPEVGSEATSRPAGRIPARPT